MYPALAVHSALMAKVPTLDTLWVGGEGGMEEPLVKRQGIQFKAIPAAGVHGVGIAALPRNLVTITRGMFAARRILGDFKPDVMFFTGGYVAVPVALAGHSIPSLLYVPDIEPGMALKSLSGIADVNTGLKFLDKTTVVPYNSTKSRYEGTSSSPGVTKA